MDAPHTDVWKEFERNVVSHSAAHHIVAIAELLERHGYARVSDVAKMLNITRGSASLTLKTLKQKGFVEEDENRFLRLSSKGEMVANAVVGKKYLIQKFLADVLGVPEELAEIDTCKIEHLISPRTAQRLTQFLRFVHSDDPRAKGFVEGWAAFNAACERDPNVCPACVHECLDDLCAEEDHEA
jgi:Mn-dependent DtxR family transcriptional regulator